MTDTNKTDVFDSARYQRADVVRVGRLSARTDSKQSERRTIVIRQATGKVIIRYAPREEPPGAPDTSAV